MCLISEVKNGDNPILNNPFSDTIVLCNVAHIFEIRSTWSMPFELRNASVVCSVFWEKAHILQLNNLSTTRVIAYLQY